MKVINTGNIFEIFDDELKTYEKFPSQAYVVKFHKLRGFYLEKYFDIEIKEDKIYGVHNEKVEKVLNTFSLTNRNLGVILSGDKGIGKSLFAKVLAKQAITQNIPVIIVNEYVKGIASYLNSIEQEVVILFDEFDKTFPDNGCNSHPVPVETENGTNISPQAELLTLFDGLSVGKKLFVITCNNVYKLNEFIVNRPGRFHYHIRFDYPNDYEIEEYLKDKLNPKYYSEIKNVVNFANRVDLNYDCLRAIAFELNLGIKFKEAIKDINIVNIDESEYTLKLIFENGFELDGGNRRIDLFSDENICIWFDDIDYNSVCKVTFNAKDIETNKLTNTLVLNGESIINSYVPEGEDTSYKMARASKIKYIKLHKVRDKNLHYLL